MIRQQTLKNVIRATGSGAQTGTPVRLTLRPAAPDSGIVFRRIDLAAPVEIKASLPNVGATRRATCLVDNDVRIVGVEHLLAAFAGLSIDNAYVDVTAPEIPLMDGSAGPFVFLIQSAGIEVQPTLRRFLRVKRPVVVKDGGHWARLDPLDGFRVGFSMECEHPVFKGRPQQTSIDVSTTSFVKEISRARTFEFVRDEEHLQERRRLMGDRLDNGVFLDENRILNEGGLRYTDEFIRHKILDAIGDLCLLGRRLIGSFSAHQAGHTLNNRLLRTLIAERGAWEETTFSEPATPVAAYLEPAYGLG